MKKVACCLLILSAIALSIRCEKKKKSEESTLIQKETAAMATPVPAVDWIKTLVVQPFRKSASGSANDAVFMKELTDCTISRLARAKELKVVLSSASKTVQQEKQADYLLTGQNEGNERKIVLSCRLVDLRKGTHLWEKTIDNDARALYLVAKAISDSVLFQLKMKSDRMFSSILGTPGDEVLNLYLEGKRYIEKNNHIAAELAVQNFKKALRIDSTFIPAWLALGKTYLSIYNNGWDRNMVWFHLAQQTAFKVLQSDSGSAEARLILGQVYYGLGDSKQAETQFREILSLNSSIKEAWYGLGNVLAESGLYHTGLDAFNRALELDLSMNGAAVGKAMVLMGLGHYLEAEEELNEALTQQPDASDLHTAIAMARYYQNDLIGAQEEIKKGFQDGVTSLLSHVVQAMIFAKQNKFDQALGEVELNVIPYLHNDASLYVAVSAVYALINRPGLSMQWLERAIEYGYKQYPWLENDPNFNSMRNDKRFIAVLNAARKEWQKRSLESH